MNLNPLAEDPKFIKDFVKRLRHEAMVQELEDEEWVMGKDLSPAVRGIIASLRDENSRLTAVILSEDFYAKVGANQRQADLAQREVLHLKDVIETMKKASLVSMPKKKRPVK